MKSFRLMLLISTAVAYDGGPEYKSAVREGEVARQRVTLQPGANMVSELERSILESDPNFQRHQKGGYVSDFETVADAPAGDADEDTDPVEDADPRARQKGESKRDHERRLKRLDDEAAADKPRVDFLAVFNGMNADEQKATYPTLQPNEKEWVDADRAANEKGSE